MNNEKYFSAEEAREISAKYDSENLSDEEKTSLVEVTTEKTDLAEEALLHTTNNIKDMDETAIKRFEKMFTPTSSEALNNVDAFNSIVSVIKSSQLFMCLFYTGCIPLALNQ